MIPQGFGAVIVGGCTFLFGLNGLVVDRIYMLSGGSIFAVPMLAISGCALGAFVGEAIAEGLYFSSWDSKTAFTRMAWTSISAALGAAIGGGLAYALMPASAGSTLMPAAFGALVAVMASGKLGFNPVASLMDMLTMR